MLLHCVQTRTEYRFASVPGWYKVEVVNMITRMGGVWQEEVRHLPACRRNVTVMCARKSML